MEEVALKDLDTRLQKQIENARKAVDKNPSYAVDILTNIVARNPACLDARKIPVSYTHLTLPTKA